eukprot:335145-Pyramimonas_sp.AAC.2
MGDAPPGGGGGAPVSIAASMALRRDASKAATRSLFADRSPFSSFFKSSHLRLYLPSDCSGDAKVLVNKVGLKGVSTSLIGKTGDDDTSK